MRVANQDNFKGKFKEKAEEYLKANWNKTVSADELAKHLGYSRFHTLHLFKETVGVNFKEFHQNIRIEKIKELLLTTNLPFESIILKVGYQSLGTAQILFKAKVGVTPSEYREMNLQ